VYRYFADFEGIFLALGTRIWQEDLDWLSAKLVDLALGTDPDVWVEVLASSETTNPASEPGRLGVARAMAAVPSMGPVLDTGYEAGGRLLARTLELRNGVEVSDAALEDCHAAFRMLHDGLDVGPPDSNADRNGLGGFTHAASALISDLAGRVTSTPQHVDLIRHA
jgi:AcrR family transcriptional regulator